MIVSSLFDNWMNSASFGSQQRFVRRNGKTMVASGEAGTSKGSRLGKDATQLSNPIVKCV
jgi:hypothetical protein